MRYSRFIQLSLASACLLFVSCSKNIFEEARELGSEELCGIDIGTKGALLGDPIPGDYTAVTYRAQLFYRGNASSNFQRFDTMITPYSGTYCDPKGANTWLTPCAVDDINYAYDSGASPAEDSCYGLRAGSNHNYYLFLSSPAVPYVKYDETIRQHPTTGNPYTMEYWGLPYMREGAAKDHPAVSPGVEISTNGLLVQDKYLYSVPEDMVLKEYRSRIAFSVRCGDAISHANFKKLEISGLRNNAVFRPFTQDFFFDDLPTNYEAPVPVYESPETLGLHLERGGIAPDFTPGLTQSLTGPGTSSHLDDTRANEYFTYVLSGDYKSLDNEGRYINTPAYLQLTLADDEGNPINLDPIPLSFIFEPQKSYFYLITVNSVYLYIDVYTADWDVPVENDAVVDDPNPLSITISIKDWTVVENSAQIDPGSGGDDAEKYDKPTGGVTPGDWNAPSGGDSVIDDPNI